MTTKIDWNSGAVAESPDQRTITVRAERDNAKLSATIVVSHHRGDGLPADYLNASEIFDKLVEEVKAKFKQKILLK